ncbi:hypothetical protein [Frankia sp. Cr2]|uniref:hypothetical protein n=1 Tax=Frankia sp. Cr2 TaxID=3073932 RepID=UPI002AD25CFF|nr:hypothetical protein [Frankia sp. Cr2]
METADPLERTELTFLFGMAFQLVLSEFVSRLDAAGYAELRPVHGLVFQLLHGSGTTSTELAAIIRTLAGDTIPPLRPVW